jgi:hypothetical protein
MDPEPSRMKRIRMISGLNFDSSAAWLLKGNSQRADTNHKIARFLTAIQ